MGREMVQVFSEICAEDEALNWNGNKLKFNIERTPPEKKVYADLVGMDEALAKLVLWLERHPSVTRVLFRPRPPPSPEAVAQYRPGEGIWWRCHSFGVKVFRVFQGGLDGV